MPLSPPHVAMDERSDTRQRAKLTKSAPSGRDSSNEKLSRVRLVLQKLRSPTTSPCPSPDTSPTTSPRDSGDTIRGGVSTTENMGCIPAAKSLSMPSDLQSPTASPREPTLSEFLDFQVCDGIHMPLDDLEKGFSIWKPYVRSQTLYMVMKTVFDYGTFMQFVRRLCTC